MTENTASAQVLGSLADEILFLIKSILILCLFMAAAGACEYKIM